MRKLRGRSGSRGKRSGSLAQAQRPQAPIWQDVRVLVALAKAEDDVWVVVHQALGCPVHQLERSVVVGLAEAVLVREPAGSGRRRVRVLLLSKLSDGAAGSSGGHLFIEDTQALDEQTIVSEQLALRLATTYLWKAWPSIRSRRNVLASSASGRSYVRTYSYFDPLMASCCFRPGPAAVLELLGESCRRGRTGYSVVRRGRR